MKRVLFFLSTVLFLLSTKIGTAQNELADSLQVDTEVLCSANLDTHILEVNISGGTPPYQVSGAVEGIVGEGLTSPFVLGPFPDGAFFSLLVIDAMGNMVTIEDAVSCLPHECQSDIGDLLSTQSDNPTDIIYLSPEDTLMVEAPYTTTEDDGLLFFYIVHETIDGFSFNETFSYDTLATNHTGIFTIADLLPTIELGKTYYVTLVGSYDVNGDGSYAETFDAPCSGIRSNTLSFSFIEDLSVDINMLCNMDEDTYLLHINVSDGVPPYQVSGSVEGVVGVDLLNPIIAGPFEAGVSYELLVEDALGNIVTEVNTPMPICQAICDTNKAGLLSADTLFVCAADTITISNPTASPNPSTDIFVYIVHEKTVGANGEDTIGHILGTFKADSLDNPTVSLTQANLPTAETNKVYYVTAITGFDSDNDGLPDAEYGCFDIANTTDESIIGTPIVFLEAITITHETYCDIFEGIFRLTFTLSGGLPAFDSTKLYEVIGLENGAFVEQDTIVTGAFSQEDTTILTFVPDHEILWSLLVTDDLCNSEEKVDSNNCYCIDCVYVYTGEDATIQTTGADDCKYTYTLDGDAEDDYWIINEADHLEISSIYNDNATITAKYPGSYTITRVRLAEFSDIIVAQDEVTITFLPCIRKTIHNEPELSILSTSALFPKTSEAEVELLNDHLTIMMFPNPITTYFNTTITGIPAEYELTAQILDITGRLLKEKSVGKYRNWKTNVEQIVTKGIFFVKLQVYDEKGILVEETIKKMVKMN